MKTRGFLIVAAALLAGATSWGAPAGGAAGRLAANKTMISLADARGRIDKAIAKPAVMKAIMKHLSAEDQKQFLSDVNAAIASMPGSDAERTAAFVAANRAALEGAQKGNVATLVAESFATVDAAALPALTESLGSDLMNRATDRGRTYTDAQYLKLAQVVMEKVNARTSEADHGDVRSGFAALMFARGSNAPHSEEITGALIAMLPASAQAAAKSEWFPAALAGGGSAAGYDAMLAAADVEATAPEAAGAETARSDSDSLYADKEPFAVDVTGNVILRVSGPQIAASLISDIAGANEDPSRHSAYAANPIYDALTAPISHQLPDLGVGDPMGDANAVIGAVIRRNEEARGYQWQTTRY